MSARRQGGQTRRQMSVETEADALNGMATGPEFKPLHRRSWWGLSLRWTMRIAGMFIVLPVIAVAILPLLVIGQEVSAPSWLRERVEQRAAAVLEGGELRFEAITVTIEKDLHPRVRMTNAVLSNPDGTILARVPLITALLSPRGILFKREVLAQEITFTGAEVALRRERDGGVVVAFDTSGTNTLSAAPGFVGLLEQFDQAFERNALSALEQVSIDGLVVNFEDERAGRSWTMDGGTVTLDLQGGMTRVRGDASLLSGRSFVTRATMSYESERGSPAARIGLTISDAAAADIATQTPALSWLGVLDARISAAFRLEIDDQGQLGPFNAALKIAAGALAPVRGARPIAFDTVRAYLSYDPAAGTVSFDEINLNTDWGSLTASGSAYLRDIEGGMPGSLLGQFQLAELHLNPDGLYPGFLDFPEAYMDFRLALDPFRVTFGNISLTDETGDPDAPNVGRLTASGEVSAAPEGWSVALDLGVDTVSTARVMEIWPIRFRPLTRVWFAENVEGGELFNIAAALRIDPGKEPVFAITEEFRDITVRPMRGQPPITGAAGHVVFEDNSYALNLSAGTMTPPVGGSIDVAGSSVVIHDTREKTPPTTIRIVSDSSITAALSTMDEPPFRYLTAAGLPVALADGRALMRGEINLALGAVQTPGSVQYEMTAVLQDVRSDVLVPGRVLAAQELQASATNAALTLSGPMRIGQVPADVVWTQPLGPEGAAGSVIDARVELSERFIDEFEIGLPEGSVGGAGTADVRLTLPPGAPPAFSLASDLSGLTIRLPGLGWSKAASAAGSLDVSGTLGDVPAIDRIAFDAAGISAEGRISLDAAGELDRVTFDRVQIGRWFDAPVTLIGRGPVSPVGVEVGGGVMDLSKATFADTGEAGGPVDLRLDRLRITEALSLTDLRGNLAEGTELSGQFTARVNGGPEVTATVATTDSGPAVRIQGEDAGAILGASGLLDDAENGSFDMTLVATGAPLTYDGIARIGGLRVKQAPVLASLLNAISVFGLLQQLSGQGLVFDEVRADFRIDPTRITVTRASAVGVGLGISLDGYYGLADGALDFQGVLSPFYLINAVGQVFTRRGEGLIGFNFNLGGTYENMSISVNPFSVLTPGMFREIFRRPPPVLRQ
jgi:hypothetical protein